MADSSRISLSVPADESLFPRVAKLGVGLVELAWVPAREDRSRSLSKALKSARLTAATVHGPTGASYDIANPDHEGRSKALELHKKHLGLCASLGAGCYVIHPGFEVYLNQIGGRWDDAKKIIVFERDEDSLVKLWETNAESLRALSEVAAELDLRIALETGPTNLITAEETVRIAKDAGEGVVGVCVDTGHVNVGGTTKPEDAIRQAGHLLWALHLHDNNGDGDFHLPPGRGRIDWPAVARALDSVSYRGTYDVELSPSDWKSESAWRSAGESVSFLGTILE